MHSGYFLFDERIILHNDAVDENVTECLANDPQRFILAHRIPSAAEDHYRLL